MSEMLPKVRFQGFTGDWEERKLRDLLNKNSEKNKNLSVINVESVSNKTGFTKQTDQFEDYSVASADLSNYYVIREKQFAYNPSRINVGSIAYKDLGDEISVVSPLYVSFSTKKVLNDGFLWNWFKTASFDVQRQRLSEGGVRDTLSFNQLSEMNTMFPTYPEQEKIGSFFKQLDNTIALHQRKLDLLKEQKKGFLQKMFPKDGQLVPEVRFAGFTDDWEQRKLGELASNFEYGLNASAKEFDGIHKYIRITDIDDSSRKFNSDSITSPDIDLSSADNYKLKNGDLLFARTGASVGKSYLYTESDGLVYYAGFLIRARLKSEFDSNFVFQNTLTNDYNNFIKVTSQRSGQPGVNAQEYASFNIKTPCYDEQQKIGLFFKQLDDLITLHQRKVDFLKEQKKGYLQKMFVS